MKIGRRVTPIYRSVMAALERRRRELKLAMWEVDDRAGTADRSFSKLLHADAPSGRQGHWETVQDLVDALYPRGYRITIEPAEEKLQDAESMRAALSRHSVYCPKLLAYVPPTGGEPESRRHFQICAERRSR